MFSKNKQMMGIIEEDEDAYVQQTKMEAEWGMKF